MRLASTVRSVPKSASETMPRVSCIMVRARSNASPGRTESAQASAWRTMPGTYRRSSLRWNAGWSRRRCSRWTAPSLVNRPVPEQHPGAPERGSLLDLRGVGQEHVPRVVRVSEQDQAATGDAEPREVAPLVVDAGEEPERVAAELEEVAAGETDHRHHMNGIERPSTPGIVRKLRAVPTVVREGPGARLATVKAANAHAASVCAATAKPTHSRISPR